MRRQTPRVYADTSVFGGVFDEEFSSPSKLFFDLVRQGRFELVVSEVVRRELVGAPDRVAQVWHEILPSASVVAITDEAVELQEAYLAAKILTSHSAEDALQKLGQLATPFHCIQPSRAAIHISASLRNHNTLLYLVSCIRSENIRPDKTITPTTINIYLKSKNVKMRVAINGNMI